MYTYRYDNIYYVLWNDRRLLRTVHIRTSTRESQRGKHSACSRELEAHTVANIVIQIRHCLSCRMRERESKKERKAES